MKQYLLAVERKKRLASGLACFIGAGAECRYRTRQDRRLV